MQTLCVCVVTSSRKFEEDKAGAIGEFIMRGEFGHFIREYSITSLLQKF